MSWWDTKQLTSFASQALKTAQKKIDKVLDIKEENTESKINIKHIIHIIIYFSIIKSHMYFFINLPLHLKAEIQLPNFEELHEEQIKKWAFSETFEDSPSTSKNVQMQTDKSSHTHHQDNTGDSSLLSYEDGENDGSTPPKHLTSLEKQFLKRKTNKIGSAKSAFRKVRYVKSEAERSLENTEKNVHSIDAVQQGAFENSSVIKAETFESELIVISNEAETEENVDKNSELPTTQYEKHFTENNTDEYDGRSLQMEDIPNELKDSSCWADASLSILSDNFGDGEANMHNSSHWENNDVSIEEENGQTIPPSIFKNVVEITELSKTTNEAKEDSLMGDTLLLKEEDTEVLKEKILLASNSNVNMEGVGKREKNSETDVEESSVSPEPLGRQSEIHTKETEEGGILADHQVSEGESLPVLEKSENVIQSTIVFEETLKSDETHTNTIPSEDTPPPSETNADTIESSEIHTDTIKKKETKTDFQPSENQKVDFPTSKSPFDQKTCVISSTMSSSSSSASTTVLQQTSDVSLQEVKLSSDDDSTPTLLSLNNSITDSKGSSPPS